MKLLLTIILVSVADCYCFATGTFLLKGKSGDSAMVMICYPEKDGSFSGKYFCWPDLKDKDFEGHKKGSGYRIYVFGPAENGMGQDTSAAIFIKPAGNHLWKGQFVSKNQHTSIVSLKEQSLVKDSCYSRYSSERKALFRSIKKDTGSYGKITYSWYQIENTPVSYLHIEKGLSAEATHKINQTMSSMGAVYAENYFSCTYQYLLTDYSFEISDVYISDHIISLCASGSYYCGNASIEDWFTAYNFNTATGTQLNLQDVLYLGHTPQTRSGEDDNHFLSDEYTQKLVELLTSLYPGQMAEPKEEGKCNYSDPGIWQYGSWYFTPSGIFIHPEFRHFDMECGEEKWSVISYSTADKYKNPSVRLMLPEH